MKPRLFPDPITNKFIVFFGTGKYLGKEDRLRSGTPTQAIYGIREQGSSSDTNYPAGYYPVDHDGLVEQNMVVMVHESLPQQQMLFRLDKRYRLVHRSGGPSGRACRAASRCPVQLPTRP